MINLQLVPVFFIIINDHILLNFVILRNTVHKTLKNTNSLSNTQSFHNDYVFKSRHGEKSITYPQIWGVLCDKLVWRFPQNERDMIYQCCRKKI